MLHLSEILMEDLQYKYIKNKNDKNVEMLLTRTYSLMYKIEAQNIYEVL